MDKKVNFKIESSKSLFYADNISMVHSRDNFVIDFRQTIPQMDNIEGRTNLSFVSRHETILLSPSLIKIFFNMLKDGLEKYEKEFGEIKIKKVDSKKTSADLQTGIIDDRKYIG